MKLNCLESSLISWASNITTSLSAGQLDTEGNLKYVDVTHLYFQCKNISATITHTHKKKHVLYFSFYLQLTKVQWYIKHMLERLRGGKSLHITYRCLFVWKR